MLRWAQNEAGKTGLKPGQSCRGDGHRLEHTEHTSDESGQGPGDAVGVNDHLALS